MSVAFRRDSDDEHLEPKFELPIPSGPNLVTARGFDLINARVTELKAQISSGGDEAGIAAAKRDLRYWQTRQVTAEVQPAPESGAVGFGATVVFLLNGKQRTITVVGDDEADPAAGLISFSAPLSRALISSQTGDILPFGGRDDGIEVLAIGTPGQDR